MTTTIQNFGPRYWAILTLQTRKHGSCYVHAKARAQSFGYKACDHDSMIFSWQSYGRSLQSGGHKYKVHAHYAETGKPVPSKILERIQP
jgi:hypothetical protein